MRIFEILAFLSSAKGQAWHSQISCFIPNHELNANDFDPITYCSRNYRYRDEIRECYDLCANNENGDVTSEPQMPECNTLNCQCGEHRNILRIEQLSDGVEYHFGSMDGYGDFYGSTDYEIYNINCKAVEIPKQFCGDFPTRYNFVYKSNSRRKCIQGRDYKITGAHLLGK